MTMIQHSCINYFLFFTEVKVEGGRLLAVENKGGH